MDTYVHTEVYMYIPHTYTPKRERKFGIINQNKSPVFINLVNIPHDIVVWRGHKSIDSYMQYLDSIWSKKPETFILWPFKKVSLTSDIAQQAKCLCINPATCSIPLNPHKGGRRELTPQISELQ